MYGLEFRSNIGNPKKLVKNKINQTSKHNPVITRKFFKNFVCGT